MGALNLRETFDTVSRWLSVYGFDDPAAVRWFLTLAVTVVVALLLYILKWIVTHRLRLWSQRTDSVWDDRLLEMLRETRWWFLLVLALFAGMQVLLLPATAPAGEIVAESSEGIAAVMQAAVILVLLAQTVVWGNALIGYIASDYVARREGRDPAVRMTVAALAWIGRLVLYTVVVLLALDNVNVDVTALVAGLGVGGIAIALAVQTILGDLLASLSIVFDKPFVPGDFIIVGDQVGTVDRIGLKTTRVNGLGGEQIIFSNQDLLQSRVHNYTRMKERRVVFSIGVTYDTPASTLAKIPPVLREIIQLQSPVRFDRAHFKEFADSSLNFEIVYYVLSPDYAVYMEVQQAINLALVERMQQMQVEFAFPTRTLHIENSEPEEKIVPRRR